MFKKWEIQDKKVQLTDLVSTNYKEPHKAKQYLKEENEIINKESISESLLSNYGS